MKTLSKYKKAQKTFGKLFLISFSFLFISLLISPFFVFQSFESETPGLSNFSTPEPKATVQDTPSRSNTKASPRSTPASLPAQRKASSEPGFPFLFTALFVTGVFSFFSTVFTFLGFLMTTIFVWRKEGREKQAFRLETKKKEIEIKKLQAELEKSKRPAGVTIKRCAFCHRTYDDISLNFCLEDGALLSEMRPPEESKPHSPANTLIMENNLQSGQTEDKTEEIEK